MLYLVTGASGWLGRRIVLALTVGNPDMGGVGDGGHEVRVLVQPGDEVSALKSWGARLVYGDIREQGAWGEFLTKAEGGILLHVAGVIHPRRSTREFEEVNVRGTRNIVLAASKAGVRRIVVLSSNSAVGASRNPAERFDEDSPCNPYMGYGRSKLAMELWLRAQSVEQNHPPITIIRAPWFYGPGQPSRQTSFFTMIKEGRFPLVGRGDACRSMAYVDSLAYGVLLAASSTRAAGDTYWLADERPYPMYEIVDTVRAVLRDDFGMTVSRRTLFIPDIVSDVARIADWTIQRMYLYNQKIHVLSEMNLTIACVIDKAARELGYRPLVELREGMRRSVDWCLAHNVRI